MSILNQWSDTIVAIATAAGPAAIAVIRLSGSQSLNIANAMFPSKDLQQQPSHSMHVGLLRHGDTNLDEVVISMYKNPRSYTGEDIVEISCHGSAYIQEQILAACIAEGARLARPGEFTQRAFLNGKLDLTQAEAVADLIAANTGAAQRNALNNVRGGFSEALSLMREQLIQFAALIELELDFATEDVEFADRDKFYTLVNQLIQRTGQLLQSFQLGNVIKHGVRVAIIGKPNAGKSTLLNALLNENRAIVSEIAGTTRDSIEENLNIKGILFRLIDTAGIRDRGTDIIENIGMDISMEKMKSADLVLYIFDNSTETISGLQQQIDAFKATGIQYILVANKDDIDAHERKELPGENILLISAKNKTGLQTLEASLYNLTVKEALFEESSIVSNVRHFEALQHLHESLQSIKQGLNNAHSGDLLTPDINNALYQLGSITGEISNEDKLDYIFSKFCIGK